MSRTKFVIFFTIFDPLYNADEIEKHKVNLLQVDMLSQHDKQKLADKFYSLYDSLAIRQPALRVSIENTLRSSLSCYPTPHVCVVKITTASPRSPHTNTPFLTPPNP